MLPGPHFGPRHCHSVQHEATAAEAALAKLSVEDKGESAIKLDEDDSYDPDDNTPPPPSKAPAKRKHRTSVFVAPINPHEAFTPKVIPKDATQTTQLETTLKRTVLFGHLSPEDQSVVINAMEHKRVTAGTNIILQGADVRKPAPISFGRDSARATYNATQYAAEAVADGLRC